MNIIENFEENKTYRWIIVERCMFYLDDITRFYIDQSESNTFYLYAVPRDPDQQKFRICKGDLEDCISTLDKCSRVISEIYDLKNNQSVKNTNTITSKQQDLAYKITFNQLSKLFDDVETFTEAINELKKKIQD